MIDICFVFFRTTNLAHLDAAWYTLSKQSFLGVQSVIFLDNNTEFPLKDIQGVLSRYPIPVPLILCHAKHGDLNKTQSWSVNYSTMTLARGPAVFFTRSDYLLSYNCLEKMRDTYLAVGGDRGGKRFVTSHCHQMGYDAQLSNTDALADYSLPGAPWRTDPRGPDSLFGVVHGLQFKSTEVDAGVWLTSKAVMQDGNGLNEKLVAWGYQQQDFQRRIQRGGTEVHVIDDFLFHHQHHWAPRDFDLAAREMNQHAF